VELVDIDIDDSLFFEPPKDENLIMFKDSFNELYDRKAELTQRGNVVSISFGQSPRRSVEHNALYWYGFSVLDMINHLYITLPELIITRSPGLRCANSFKD